jgi:selenocysteine lyase/cysteine desulfurase
MIIVITDSNGCIMVKDLRIALLGLLINPADRIISLDEVMKTKGVEHDFIDLAKIAEKAHKDIKLELAQSLYTFEQPHWVKNNRFIAQHKKHSLKPTSVRP